MPFFLNILFFLAFEPKYDDINPTSPFMLTVYHWSKRWELPPTPCTEIQLCRLKSKKFVIQLHLQP